MSLDVRDLKFWVQEARRKGLARKYEQMEVTLLPNQKTKNIRKTLDRTRNELLEIDLGDQAEEVEKLTKERRKYYEDLKREMREKRKC